MQKMKASHSGRSFHSSASKCSNVMITTSMKKGFEKASFATEAAA
jgi:hypothetical protein